MSDESMQTHVVAVFVGVAITLFLVNTFQKNGKDEPSADDNSSTTNGATSAGKSKKKKKKKKSKAQGNETSNEASLSTPSSSDKAVEGDEEVQTPTEPEEAAPAAKSNKKKKKKKSKANKVATPADATATEEKKGEQQINVEKKDQDVVPTPKPKSKKPKQSQEDDGGWIVEPIKKKKNRGGQKQRGNAPGDSAEVKAPVASSSESVVIDARKVGMVIGPKGATMKAIEEATNCKLEVNAPKKDDDAATKRSTKPQTATVVLSGDKDAIKKAKKAIKELDTKGYASILQSDGFGESSINIHPRYLSELVGPGGRTIKALQSTLDIKVTIPSTNWKPGNSRTVGMSSQQLDLARVGLAGAKENVKQAKEVIKALMREHHHEITHPGMIHEYVFVPSEFFHCVIGARGSEIKHIKGNYKVEVYMPNNDQYSPATKNAGDEDSVLVVGRKSDVDRAISHIHNLMDRDTEQREKKYDDEDY